MHFLSRLFRKKSPLPSCSTIDKDLIRKYDALPPPYISPRGVLRPIVCKVPNLRGDAILLIRLSGAPKCN